VPARRFLVSGRVQGVGFRWHTVRAASALGLTGWVRNLPDGGVEVLAEGSPEALKALEAELRRGPLGAAVHDVESIEVEESGRFEGFRVDR
jgi:acylphosphatase